MTGPRAFADAEYTERHRKVRERMAARGVDVLYVTSPANIVYLCGYEASWYPPRLPLGVVVVRDPPALVFFDWTRHRAYAELHAHSDEIVYFDYGDAIDVVRRIFMDRRWNRRVVAIEKSSLNPCAAVTMALWAALASVTPSIVSGDWIVDGVRAFKSAAEVARVRAAAAIADVAFTALYEQLRPGLTELQVAALLTALLADAGSEVAAQPVLVSSGPTAWRDTHAFPSHRAIEPGDLVAVDGCGCVDRYHANLSRTFAIGEVSPTAAAWLDAGRGALDEFCRLAVCGDGPEHAMESASQWLRERVPPENVWWIGGYSLGISLPPSWVGHTYLDNSGPEQIVLAPGYVSNFETILVSPDESFEAAAIDTLVVTERGAEVLSTIPRTILTVET